jgi:hypothetical protein
MISVGRIFWMSVVIAFICDAIADLAFGNAAVNVAVAIGAFVVSFVLIYAVGTSSQPQG